MVEPALTELLKRLELATLKLENIAAAQFASNGQSNSSCAHANATTLDDAARAEVPAVAAFSELLEGPLKTYVGLSTSIGGLVSEQAANVDRVFQAQHHIIVLATKAKKPDPSAPVFGELIKPLQQASAAICEVREKNRPSPLFNHLSTVSEGIPALGWVAVEPKPAPFVGEMKDSATFFSNRVIKEYKDKDRKHVDWANSYVALLTDLQAYVKHHHTTGLVWNANGGDLKSLLGHAPALPPPSPARSGVLAPPPPPPPNGGNAAAGGALEPPKKADMTSIFGDLNKGSAITSGLKKVDKSQMTHKNPELRTSSVVKGSAVEKQPPAISSTKATTTNAPPKMQLEGNKWIVENYTGGTVTLDQLELKQVIYIYGCTNTTIQIKGKVNTVSVDNCKKSALVVDTTVAGIDLVNCKSMQLQILNLVPTIAVDKTDGCQIYLSRECIDKKTELLTAKCSEVNVSWPETASPNAEFVEKAVSEQFRTVVLDGKVVTVPVEHKG